MKTVTFRFRRVALLVAATAITACTAAAEIPMGTPEAAVVPTPHATLGPNRTPESARSPESVLGLAPIGPTETARVVRVVDGDTIVVDRGQGHERLRYIGVDTPESVKPSTPIEPYAEAAAAANEALVGGRDVVLERDVTEYDRYGRLLRYVWTRDGSGWTLVNLALVSAGFAHVMTYPPDVRYVDLYLAAEREARERGEGLWADEPRTPAPTPLSFVGGGDAEGNTDTCDPAYPGVCIPPPPPDLDCGDITFRRFQVLAPDPHRFDGDHDGVGCEGT